MTEQEFERVDHELLEKSNAILLNRKKAYAQDNDRLANFKETASMVGLTPEKVCEVYLYKALTAMMKILHGRPAVGETALERFVDTLNYVRLAYALHREGRVLKAPAADPLTPRTSETLEELRAREERKAQLWSAHIESAKEVGRAKNRFAD